MDTKLRIILADLYKLDPSFKKHAPMIEKIVKELLESRPDTKFDVEFKQELYVKLQARIAAIEEHPQPGFWKIVSNTLKGRSFAYAVSGLVVIVLIVVSTVNLNKTAQPLPDSNIGLFSSQVNITKKESNSFGSLAAVSGNFPELSQSQGLSKATGLGGGSSSFATAEMAEPALAPDRMIMPMTIYNYVYVGDDFELNESEVEVLHRLKDIDSSQSQNIIKQLNFAGIDLSSFNNPTLQNFSMSENKDYGYTITVDFREGSLSINQNWEQWLYPQYESSNLDISDVPSDDKLISIANKFLQAHKISTTAYSDPVVLDNWRQSYVSSQEKNMGFYVPETITVIYPLSLNDEIVYDYSGNPFGLYLNVNIRANKVSSLSNLTTNNYDSSLYQAETSKDKILEIASRGGSLYPISENSQVKKIDIEIGTPEKILLKTYYYDGQQSQELIVPALRFPVTKTPAGEQFYQNNIIVPLVKDILDLNQDSPVPMPLLR